MYVSMHRIVFYRHVIMVSDLTLYILYTLLCVLFPFLIGSSNRVVKNIYSSYDDLDKLGQYTNIDAYGHGTHVAGIIGGEFDGVARECNIFSMKVLGNDGSGYTSDIIEAMEYVALLSSTSGRKSVVSMSLGGPCFDRCKQDPLNMAVESLLNNYGVLTVVAAGNDNRF